MIIGIKNIKGVEFMGKRYKKGNKGKTKKNRGYKRKYMDNDIYIGEQNLNDALRDFSYYNHIINPNSIKDYDMMYRKKTHIKKLISIQESKAYRMNYRRYQFLGEQIEWFKKVYVNWKKKTFYIFLTQKLKVPTYLVDDFYDRNYETRL